jgi:hypothetical protein
MLVIVGFRSVVQHGHDVRVVVLVVIVERIEENAKTVPLVGAAKDGTLETFGRCEPKCQTVSSDSSASCHPEFNENLPPVVCAAKREEIDFDQFKINFFAKSEVKFGL